MTTLFTRANAQHAEAVLPEVPMYDDAARLGLAARPASADRRAGRRPAAGTSDLPVAREAA